MSEGAIRKRYAVSHVEQKKQQALSRFRSLFQKPPETQKTAVLGVRGLEEDGAPSREKVADPKAVQWMENLRVSDAEVAAFIAEGDLNP